MTRRRERVRVLHLLPDLAVGGGQVIVLNIASERRAGVDHHVCALDDGPIRERFADAGVPVAIVPLHSWAGAVRAARQVARLVQRERIDVLHTNNTPRDRLVGQIAGFLSGRPIVNTFMAIATSHRVREPGEPIRAFAGRRIGNLGNRALARWNVDAFVALSDAVRRSHASALRMDPERIVVVRPGLTPDAYERSSELDIKQIRSILDVEGAYPVIVSVGRLDENKGQRGLPTIMEHVLRDLPDAHMLVVGDGPDRAAVEGATSRSPARDRLRLLGSRSDVRLLLESSDVFLSTAMNEGFGMAAVEAMAAGCPVVAHTNPGVAIGEFVTDGRTGRLVAENSAPSLAAAIVDVAASHDRREEMARHAAEDARQHSIARTAEQLEVIYRNLVKGDAQ